jgi:hypothetical protein
MAWTFACHAWCYFDSMLSGFCCSMTCIKWLRLLNVPLKESSVVFVIWEHIIVVFSFHTLFGLTWHMLTTCLTLTSHHKPLWSFGFWLVIPLYASVNNVLSLCMIMTVIALLVGRSQSFSSLHFVLRENTYRASNSQKLSFPMCLPYLPISNLLFQAHSSCFLSILQIKLFVMWKLVSKALTNLTAHFTFIAFNKFYIVALLCWHYACKL